MKPGAYVVGRGLQMSGLASFGTHEFIVLVPQNPGYFGRPVQDLGDGSKGLIVGAYDIDGKLKARFFASPDTGILQAFLKDPKNGSRVQIEKVNLEKSMCSMSVDDVLRKIATVANNYVQKKDAALPDYPKGLLGQLSPDCRNSNSWAQTVIELSVGAGAVLEDFDGADLCGDKRLSSSYFNK